MSGMLPAEKGLADLWIMKNKKTLPTTGVLENVALYHSDVTKSLTYNVFCGTVNLAQLNSA